ncbi:MAG: helix-turn-helix domain-containing protein, partial [Planctomycetota bacterium]
MQTGRVVRAFADVRQLSAELDPCSVEAILIPLRVDPPATQEAALVREVACWIRQCATARSVGPVILSLDVESAPAPASLQISALHRGATAVLPCGDSQLLKELIDAQLRHSESRRAEFAALGDSGRPNGSTDLNRTSNPERQVTLTPRARPTSEGLLEPGWVPSPADFTITEDDPIDLKLYERKAVLRAIAAADGNRTVAAQLLGIGKSTLYRRLSEWRAESD